MPKNLFFTIVILPTILYAIFASDDSDKEIETEPVLTQVTCIVTHDDKCFFDPENATVNLAWETARSHCIGSDGSLARKEQVLPVIDELKTYFQSKNKSISHLWTNDRGDKPQYAWVEHFDGGGSNWATKSSDKRNYVSFVCTR